jgi:hypothetical protein
LKEGWPAVLRITRRGPVADEGAMPKPKRNSGVFTVRKLAGEIRSAERRADPRVVVDARVTAIHGTHVRRYRLTDVSRSGALVERGPAPPPPALHRLEIEIGEGEPLRVLARTVWVGPRHHAVRFLAQDDIDRLELAEVIDRLVRHCAA